MDQKKFDAKHICANCGKEFYITEAQERSRQKQNTNSRRFCSRSCFDIGRSDIRRKDSTRPENNELFALIDSGKSNIEIAIIYKTSNRQVAVWKHRALGRIKPQENKS